MKENFKNTNYTLLDNLYIGDFFILPDKLTDLYLLLSDDFEILNLSTDTIDYASDDTKVIKIPHSKVKFIIE